MTKTNNDYYDRTENLDFPVLLNNRPRLIIGNPAELLEKAFSPFHICNPFRDTALPGAAFSDIRDLRDIPKVRGDFYAQYYNFPTLQYGISKDDGADKFEINDSDSFNNFMPYICPQEYGCAFSILVGKVGKGKSVFGSALISKYLSNFLKHGIFPLRLEVNIENILQNNSTEERLEEHFFHHLHDLLNVEIETILVHISSNMDSYKQFSREEISNSLEKIKAMRPVNSKISGDARQKFIGLISIFSELKIKAKMESNSAFDISAGLFLFIDGLDTFYYKHDKSRFVDEQSAEDFINDIKFLSDLVRGLKRILAGQSNMRISLMIPLRKTVAETVNFVAGNEQFGFGLANAGVQTSTFRISEPEILDVIKGRFSLLASYVNLYRQDELREKIQKILATLDTGLVSANSSAKSGVETVFEIASVGYRSVIHAVSLLSWCFSNIESVEVFNRYMTEKAPAPLSYIMDGRSYYSQGSSGFPNMFLVRGDVPSFKKENNGLLISHKPTYWLKHLMLMSISAFEKKNNLPEKYENLYSNNPHATIKEIFCPSDGSGYAPKLVGLCLGSLANEARYAAAEPLAQHTVASSVDGFGYVGFKLTSRGKWIIEQALTINYFNILYFQLLVDDPLLQLPKNCGLEQHFKSTEVYNYLYDEDSSKYQKGVSSILETKIPRMILFTYILEHSYNYERGEYPKVFSVLEGELKLPRHNFENVRENIYQSAEKILHRNKGEIKTGCEENIADSLEKIVKFYGQDKTIGI